MNLAPLHLTNLVFVLQVYSPFELTVLRPHRPVVTGSHRFGSDRRSGVADEPLVVDWETLDQGVWNVVKALKLLPPEVLEASLAIPFPKELQTQKNDSVVCSQLCDPNLSMMKRKQPEHLLGGRAGAPDALA
jgi:hypothetical protein